MIKSIEIKIAKVFSKFLTRDRVKKQLHIFFSGTNDAIVAFAPIKNPVFGQVSEKRYLSTSTKYSPQKVLKYKN